MKRPKVVYWNTQPSPSFVDRLNAVAENGNVEVEAWFETERDADRSWRVDPATWNFRGSYLSWTTVAGLEVPLPDRRLRASAPDLIITAIDRRVAPIAVGVGRALAARVASRTLPSFATWVSPTRLATATYHTLYRAIDGAKVSGPDGEAMAVHYGLPAERCMKVTQSINVDLYAAATRVLLAEREEGRRARGLSGCVFLYVGRLHHQKGVRHLLSALALVQKSGVDASLLVVGDGADEVALRRLSGDLPGVHFEGFVEDLALPAIYGLADVLVFPTLGDPNGLVVEEAMAAGLPVIATENAGDISSRIVNFETGFVVPALDPSALADKMRYCAREPDRRAAMAHTAQGVARGFTLQHYANDFDNFVDGILALPARSTAEAWALGALGRTVLAAGRHVGDSRTVSGSLRNPAQ